MAKNNCLHSLEVLIGAEYMLGARAQTLSTLNVHATGLRSIDHIATKPGSVLPIKKLCQSQKLRRELPCRCGSSSLTFQLLLGRSVVNRDVIE